ncbi:MAG: hypothetical protein LUF78_10775 [Clostridiales bacterium]|nr:hypothetical protein [Clostridiales bacterium]
MDESILTSIKKLLGLAEDYEFYDPDIIMLINSAFSVLTQLGVGPDEGFSISDASAVWGDFTDDTTLLLLKECIYLRVRIAFDITSLTSAMIDTYTKQIAEDEWRLSVAAETTAIESEA